MEKIKNIIIIILTILALALGGLFIYDKLSKKPQENDCTQTPETSTNNNYQSFLDNLKDNIQPEVITLSSAEMNGERQIYLDKDGNVYLLQYDETKTEKRVEITSISNETGIVYGYKLNLNNIIDLYVANGISQSGISVIYALDEKGNIYYVASSFDWNDETITTSTYSPILIKELKEIVDIESIEQITADGNYSLKVIATKYNGKKVNVYDLISQNGYTFYDSAN